jgi:HEAT repeat protein
MTYYIVRLAYVVTLGVVVASPACGQPLARRLESVSAANVEFHFAARSGVCGDGRYYIRTDNDSWIGSWSDAMRPAPCDGGPVRVVLVRADREPVRLETFVGPLTHDSSASDVGRVSAQEAAAYLLGIARANEGRVARDALLPASLADSASVVAPMLAIARDQTKARELRRSALGYATRRRATPDALGTDETIRTVLAMARDETEHSNMRQHAASQLGSFPRGEGIPALVQLASSGTDVWLAKYAAEVLGRSGDPRARRALRELAESDNANGDVRAQAIRGLVNEYATGQDAELLRRIYPKLASDRTKDAALDAAASVGGASNREWLVGIVRNTSEQTRQRQKAAGLLDRAGTPVRELARLYDEIADDDIRSALIDEMAQIGTREATAKLMAIAKDNASYKTRRKAITVLGRFDDPGIREALKGLAERP